MEQSCQKCGARVGGEQAFCPRCGAVVGMSDAGGSQGGEWDMASTMVGKKMPIAPPPAPKPTPPPPQPQPQQQQHRHQQPQPPRHQSAAPSPARTYQTLPAQPAAPQAPARGGNTMLIAVIGFAAVLIIGGLLLFLLYLNSQG